MTCSTHQIKSTRKGTVSLLSGAKTALSIHRVGVPAGPEHSNTPSTQLRQPSIGIGRTFRDEGPPLPASMPHAGGGLGRHRVSLPLGWPFLLPHRWRGAAAPSESRRVCICIQETRPRVVLAARTRPRWIDDQLVRITCVTQVIQWTLFALWVFGNFKQQRSPSLCDDFLAAAGRRAACRGPREARGFQTLSPWASNPRACSVARTKPGQRRLAGRQPSHQRTHLARLRGACLQGARGGFTTAADWLACSVHRQDLEFNLKDRAPSQ
jgi:hypothetical protein